MSRRRAEVPEEGLRCGWCSSGCHLPTETSRGCSRYRDPSSASARPCPCTHPTHDLKENLTP